MTEPTTRIAIDLSTGMTVERIVVPVTLDHRYDRGVSAAVDIAERFDLPMLLVCVDLGTGDSIDLDRRESMDAACSALVAAHPGVVVEDLILAGAGDPAVALAARLEPQDLVVLATEAMDGPAGSFAQHLVGNSNAPVLMFGPAAALDSLVGDVVVAVDGSVLAERSIPAAFGFASALGSNIRLIEVVSNVVSDHVRRLREKGERVSENAYIRDLATRLDDPRVSWKVIHHDDPAIALSDAARNPDTAMIVMSTHGREGFVAQVFSSVALETVRYSRCPVLVQRPVAEPLTAIAG
jgi:nucleotide-binding universal stress UspA family protein